MIYALILTVYMQGEFDKSPVSVSQSSTIGFTSQQACINAGKVAQAGAPRTLGYGRENFVIYQCSPLSL